MPTQNIYVPGTRATTAAAPTAIFNAYNAIISTATGVQGFYAGPFTLPSWVDPSYPIRAIIYPVSVATPGTPNLFVDYLLSATVYRDDVSLFQIDVNTLFEVPNPWTADTHQSFELDDGSGVAFPGDSFEPGDSIGFRLLRLGTSANDTLDVSIATGYYVNLIAHRRCSEVCCGG